jgi:RND superfamily putative drug exporter
MKSLAVGAISVGIVSVLAALTLLPALLGKLGDHVDSLRVPFIGRNIGSGGEGRFWGGVVRARHLKVTHTLEVSCKSTQLLRARSA